MKGSSVRVRSPALIEGPLRRGLPAAIFTVSQLASTRGLLGLPPADRAGVGAGKAFVAAVRTGADLLEHPEELADTANEQLLLVDFDPRSGRGGEDDVIAGLDRHLHPGALPPVEPRADCEHDPVLRRRLMRAGRDHEAGAPHPVGLELLDDHTVEYRSEQVSHRDSRLRLWSAAPWPHSPSSSSRTIRARRSG